MPTLNWIGKDKVVNHATSVPFHVLEHKYKLLADDGAIFISIDENEQANLKLICDEIFSANNFLVQMSRVTKRSGFYKLNQTLDYNSLQYNANLD
jgi:methyl coenzyme M reductase subunit D